MKNVEYDFASVLNERLTDIQRRLVEVVADEALDRGLPLYAVGGLPRDLWLGSPSADLDLVVEGDAIALARALASRYGGQVTAHSKFGTIKWDLRGTQFEAGSGRSAGLDSAHGSRHLDLVTARRESYRHPGALPTVHAGTIEDDVRRRDFTINTLAVRLDGNHFGQLRDDLGALEDLKAGLVRVLHPNSFSDDPTRMYRAVRYEQRFTFRISADTLRLMPAARSLVAGLSGHRVRHELDLILDEVRVPSMLQRLGRLGLLKAVHPALPGTARAFKRVGSAAPSTAANGPRIARRDVAWMLWLAELDRSQITSLTTRLRMTRESTQNIRAAAKLFQSQSHLADRSASRCSAYLDEYPEAAIYSVSLVSGAKPRRVMLDYLTKWKLIRPVTTGHDLKKAGLPPGPAYKSILRQLRDAWIDGDVSDAVGERGLLQELLLRHHEVGTAQKGASLKRSRRRSALKH